MRLLDAAQFSGPETARRAREAIAQALVATRLKPGLVMDLQTAVTEIVNNALEHAEPPAGVIGVTIELAGEWLEVVIEDDGAPFHDFARHAARPPLNPLELRLEDGGLGLFLVRRLFPDCHYVPGHPNRFRLRRNLAVRRPRILLIEDETSLRRLYEGMLLRDFDVVACATGREAIDRFGQTSPDIVLSDINLPDMDGIDLLAVLDADPARAPVPLVIISGDAAPETRRKAIDLGIDGFLSKPVTPVELMETMRRVLARSKRERARLIQHYSGRLSQSIAPRLTGSMGALRAAIRHHPAGTGGGDFVLRLGGGGSETILFGDVMGHGIGAKILCHALAGYLSGFARSLEPDIGPAGLLARLSDAIADDLLLDGAVVTAVALAFDSAGVITLANAGHPQPLLITGGETVGVGVVGPLPGLMSVPRYVETIVALEPGQRLVIYTDGILPAADSVGTAERLPACLAGALSNGLGLSLDAAADAFAATIEVATLGQPPDDWCCLLLERAPAAA